MADSNISVTPGAGAAVDTYQVAGSGDHRQYVISGDHGGFGGRYTTYRIPGRAVTTGQNLAAIYNASGSTIVVDVNFVGYDVAQQAVVAPTVLPPIVRVLKLTTIPTGGTAGFKVPDNSALTSNASVTTWQDASAEGTSSGTALAFTQTTAASGLTQEYMPRLLALGTSPATNFYEPADRMEFLQNGYVTLRANEGIGVRLEYTAAAQNPITNMHVVTMLWEEYTP